MTGAFSPAIWRDPTPLLILGTGAALPGEPIATEALLAAVDRRFGLSLRRPESLQPADDRRPVSFELEGSRIGVHLHRRPIQRDPLGVSDAVGFSIPTPLCRNCPVAK